MPLSHRGRGSTTTTQLWLPHQRRSRKGCSGFKMLQRVWSQRPGNTSVVCRGWCMMICTGWVFLSGCSTSLLSQSIVVSDIGLQRISPTTVCQFPQFPVVTICDLPDVINIVGSTCSAQHLRDSDFFSRRAHSFELTAWWSAWSNCELCKISAGPERRTCSPDIRRVSALGIFYVMRFTNRHLRIYLLTMIKRFYRAMHFSACAVLVSHVVRPSVRLWHWWIVIT